jgi:5-methyltetrahydropteroyltriglutamate--homocysteine methyltransferase
MKRSTDRILTTHTGSLPRPPDLTATLEAMDAGTLPDPEAFDARVRQAVAEVVRKQLEAGVDIVNDGEQGKVGYSTYVRYRLTGFEGRSTVRIRSDWADFPEAAARYGTASGLRPACNGPIAWKDRGAVLKDIAHLQAAVSGVQPTEVFMTAASPGVIAHFLQNDYYPSREAYLARLADVMKEEYDAIYQAGFVLQVDCPDLAMGRHLAFPDLSTAEFLKIAEANIEALNHALRDIPPDRLRLHLCWGNYEGPHHRDIPLKDIIGVVLKARPQAISFEGANPRHEHEWAVFREVKLPEDKIIIPGVLDSTTNFIEHPELVAQRLVRYAQLVGRENVIAGSDCGFATFARSTPLVEPEIVWAKLQAMAEGARLASAQLWG